MTYYSNKKNKYIVDGIEVYMTEEDAEIFQSTHPDVDITASGDIVPDEELEYLEECTCLPDLPNGAVNGGRGDYCPSCRALFEELL